MIRTPRRRGQAALEFLSTYGFAFLLILVMIGALSYFGILNPSNLVPDRCTSGAEFSCFDNIVQTNGGAGSLNLVLNNNLGGPVNVSGLVITVPDLALTPAGCTITPATPATVAAGGRVTIACASLGAAGALPAGEKVKVTYSFTYQEPGRFAKTSAGELLATVQS
jgi:hypothetical protein